MHLAQPRALFLLAFLACASLLGMGFYLQYAQGLEPCPLCIVQRIFFAAAGLFALLAAIHGRGRRAYALTILLFALLGAATAGRQIWLQSLPPDQLPACLPPLEFMLQSMPYADILWTLFHGSADCAEVTWTLLGLSIPEWSLLAFSTTIVFAIFQLLRRDKSC